MDDDRGLNEFGPAAEEGERLHELFGRTVRRATPRIGFTADAVVGAGRRRVRRRRAAAVLGTTTGVVVIALAVSTASGSLTTSQPDRHGGTTSPAMTGLPGMGPPAVGPSLGEDTSPDHALALQSARVVAKELDSGGKHIVWQSLQGYGPVVEDVTRWADGRTKDTAYYDATGWWSASGTTTNVTSGLRVDVTFTAPQYASSDLAFRSSTGAAWGPIGNKTLPDGSVVQSATSDSAYVTVEAERTYKNGAILRITVLTPRNTPVDPALAEHVLVTAVGDATIRMPFQS